MDSFGRNSRYSFVQIIWKRSFLASKLRDVDTYAYDVCFITIPWNISRAVDAIGKNVPASVIWYGGEWKNYLYCITTVSVS